MSVCEASKTWNLNEDRMWKTHGICRKHGALDMKRLNIGKINFSSWNSLFRKKENNLYAFRLANKTYKNRVRVTSLLH